MCRDGGLRTVTDATLGGVDGAPQCDGVVWVNNCLQVGQGIFDFEALVKPSATNDFVGNPGAEQHFFDNAGLSVGAVEDCNVAPVDILDIEGAQLRNNQSRFIVF